MKIEDLDEDIRKKVERKQKHINTKLDINLEKLGYRNVEITKHDRIHWILIEFEKSCSKKDYNPDDWFRCRPDFNSPLEEKIKNRQRYITTDRNLEKFGYGRQTKYFEGKAQWKFISIYYSPEEKLMIKIENKQKTILTDEDLSKNGYHIHSHSFKTKQWILDEAKREQDRKYSKTEKGKIAMIRGGYRHRQKGFLIVFNVDYPEGQKKDYHHIAPNLPFVIPVPREIHQSIHGSNPNHYSGVTTKFCEWLKEHPEIKIKDKLI